MLVRRAIAVAALCLLAMAVATCVAPAAIARTTRPRLSDCQKLAKRSGKRLALSAWACQLGYGYPPHCTDGTNYDEVGMAPSGAGAYEVTDYASAATTLQAFDAAGTFTKLADGAVDALTVTSTEIRWTQGATTHTASLP